MIDQQTRQALAEEISRALRTQPVQATPSREWMKSWTGVVAMIAGTIGLLAAVFSAVKFMTLSFAGYNDLQQDVTSLRNDITNLSTHVQTVSKNGRDALHAFSDGQNELRSNTNQTDRRMNALENRAEALLGDVRDLQKATTANGVRQEQLLQEFRSMRRSIPRDQSNPDE